MIELDGPFMDQVEDGETSDNEMDILDGPFEHQAEACCSYEPNMTRKRKNVSIFLFLVLILQI
jgi:hypothetical protein